MRFLYVSMVFFLLFACKPNKKVEVPISSLPTVKQEIGVYRNATVYTGKSDYEFEVNGQALLISVSNFDTLNNPSIPSNLEEPFADGLPGPNPLLVGAKFLLEYGPDNILKRISLAESHDPSDPELPALPENYSGLLSVAPTDYSRAYLNLSADLTAILLINYDIKEPPTIHYGRWTRTAKGTRLVAQFAEESWEFLVRGNNLILATRQMGTGGLKLEASNQFTICEYVRNWLSELSTTDGEPRVLPNDMSQTTPLSEVLRTEHAYMGLYGLLEAVFKVEEATTAEMLRKKPTVAGVCDLVLHLYEEGGH